MQSEQFRLHAIKNYMLKSIKNDVVVSAVLDSRTINKEGTYPVKIKVYY